MKKIKQYINDKTVIIAAILLCILISGVTAIRLYTFWPYSMEINMDEMSGSMLTDEDGSKYIFSGSSEYVLYGPYMSIYKGYYTVDIDYDTDNDCIMDVHSNETPDYVVSGDIILKAQSSHKRFNIRIKDEIDDFELRVKYSGYGDLRVKRITLTENTAGITTSAFLAVGIVIFVTMCYLCREKIKKNKYTLAALAAITFFSCVPMMTFGICSGHDGIFHMLRIEGLAEGLKLGEFPVRMQSNWMEGYGYPVSVYYGDLLLYIPALLRIIGFSVTQSYKAYVFLINLGTTLIAYLCLYKIIKNDKAALLGTAGYVFAAYRLTNLYVRLAMGEYSAMMFLPLVFLAVYRIYTEDETVLKEYIKNAVLLAVAMTGLVQTHLISVATVSITIALVCILMFRKTIRRNTMIVFASAVVITVALNLFFLVPFMDYSENVPVSVLSDDGTAQTIQAKGAYIGQYFMLYQRAFGGSGENIGDRMALTPGIVLMAVFFAGICYCIKYHDKIVKFITFMSALMLWMSSNLFPWNFIINHVPLMGWVCKIQFPWRFLPIAQLFLAFGLCILYVKIKEEKQEQAGIIVLILLIVSTTQMFSGVIQQRSFNEKYDAAGLDSFFLVYADYVRTDTNINYFDGEVYTNNVEIIEDYTRQGKYAIIKCKTINSSQDAWVELPIMNYKNYAAYGENGASFLIEDGSNNVVRVILPDGYSGMVAVTYEIPGLYRAADIVSLIAALATAAVMFLLNRKQIR